jgi:hypothetical protein
MRRQALLAVGLLLLVVGTFLIRAQTHVDAFVIGLVFGVSIGCLIVGISRRRCISHE